MSHNVPTPPAPAGHVGHAGHAGHAGPAVPPGPRGPVRPGPGARTALRPAAVADIDGGFWHGRREVNSRVGIPQGPALLDSAGNLHNLRLAAGSSDGAFRGDYPFMDSDVYKWLEAASWQLGQSGGADPELSAEVDRITAMVAAAQEPDGYLNTWFQVTKDGRRYEDLRWGHELYCAGHLIQAAVAHHRATGGKDLLEVAVRFADHLDSVFGHGKAIDGFDGHPEVETALVELYRETGERRYLDLAGYFVDRHGHGLLGGEAYCQDRVPLREQENVEGHAVRQLYLLAAAADLAAETGEDGLREACERLWAAMAATKTHITGGLGAHHDEEDFGDPFELPNERAYCETCAAVASVHFGWRMALLTGRARYSDLVERTLFNGFLAGVSLDGESWLYVNPLQVRDGHTDTGGDQSARRTRWFRCACCPPNVMRLLASLEHYVASCDGDGLQLHQYATGRFGGDLDGDPLTVSVNTAYPWSGDVTVTVADAPAGRPWTLSLRVPQWCPAPTVRVGGEPVEGARAEDGWLRLRRVWAPGEEVVLDLPMRPRLVEADPRADAVRGCVAVERGPLVYCLEGVDHPGGGLDDVVIDVAAGLAEDERADLLGAVVTVRAFGRRRALPAGDWWPYREAAAPAAVLPAGRPGREERAGEAAPDAPAPDAPAGRSAAAEREEHAEREEYAEHAGRAEHAGSAEQPRAAGLVLTAVPYYAWANRQDGAMRVWLPTS